MRKNQTLFMALALFLCSAVTAQAQNFAEVKLFTTPADFAREGGKNEAAGSILLNSSDCYGSPGRWRNDHAAFLRSPCGRYSRLNDTRDVTVTGEDTDAAVTGMAENDDNDGNGTIMIGPTRIGAGQNLLIQGVMLDVSGADGPVTVTLKVTAGPDDFIRIDGASSAMVISGIKVGVEASVTAVTVRTRGTGAGGVMASLTLKESFKGAFMTGNMVTVDFSGIPKEVTLTAMVTSNLVAMPDADPARCRSTSMTPYATAGAVKDGSVTVMLGGTGDMVVRQAGSCQRHARADVDSQ